MIDNNYVCKKFNSAGPWKGINVNTFDRPSNDSGNKNCSIFFNQGGVYTMAQFALS